MAACPVGCFAKAASARSDRTPMQLLRIKVTFFGNHAKQIPSLSLKDTGTVCGDDVGRGEVVSRNNHPYRRMPAEPGRGVAVLLPAYFSRIFNY